MVLSTDLNLLSTDNIASQTYTVLYINLGTFKQAKHIFKVEIAFIYDQG